MQGQFIEDYFGSSPWIGFDMRIWEPIIGNCTPVSYKKNSTIFEQQRTSQTIFIIRKGRARVAVYHPSGAEKHVYFAEEGCPVGESAVLLGLPLITTASTIVDCQIYKIPRDVFETTMLKNPAFAMTMVNVLSRKVMMLTAQLTELAFTQSHSRVSISLVNLVRQYGEETSDGIRIGIKFTHEELARLVNTSRVTVSNIFNHLAGEGIIARIDGYFVIKDFDGLLRLARAEMGIE